MYIDVKETIKKYFLVRMKEACGDALSLEPILSFKKNLQRKVIVTNGNRWVLLDLRTPHLLLMILMQNFIVINNHIKPQV